MSEILTEECENCDGTGISGHQCIEDCCFCIDPEENALCFNCQGTGKVVDECRF